MESLGGGIRSNYTSHRSHDELDSHVSYETGGGGGGGLLGSPSNDDDDPILTATITFDVTVDPNGQVISTSEGQIIAEGIHQPIDGRTLNLLEHNPIPIAQITSGQINGGSGIQGIQADSLTSMNSAMGAGAGNSSLAIGGGPGVGATNRSKDLTILQDSLDESESDAESTSTSTESLIERSKRYMNQEAGIIILKRENSQAKNFNINLDFDLNQKHQEVPLNGNEKGFNINLDFDIDQRNSSSGNNLSSSHQVPQQQQLKKTGVDIDLMITSSATNSRMETRENSYEVGHPTHHYPVGQQQQNADVEYWRMSNGGPSKKSLDPNQIENDMSWTALHSTTTANPTTVTNNGVSADYSKLISEPAYQSYHVNSKMDSSRRGGESLEQENARYGLIDKIVERAVNRPGPGEKDSFYSQQLPKVGKFTLDEVLEHVLRHSGGETASGVGIGLRSLDQADLAALLKGFEPEEAAEGKLVLYITEKQLLQLLKQRAVIVPNASDSSFNGDRSKRLKAPSSNEASYRPSNPLGSMFESGPITQSQQQTSQQQRTSEEVASTEVYRTSNSLSSIVEEEHHRRTHTTSTGTYGTGTVTSATGTHTSTSGSHKTTPLDNHFQSYTPTTHQQSQTVYRSIPSMLATNGAIDGSAQRQKLSSSSQQSQQQPPVIHHDLIVLNEIENFLRRVLVNQNPSDQTVDWAAVRAEYAQHPDRPELMKRFVSSLLDERTRVSPIPKGLRVATNGTIPVPPNNEEEKLKAVDDFVDSVINRKRQKESDRSLKQIDSLLDRLLDRKQTTTTTHELVTVSESEVRTLEAFVQRLKDNHPSKQAPGNKIIIRTTRKLPAKVYITGGDGKNLVRKKITYSYLDNYRPSTRVYEVAGGSNGAYEPTAVKSGASAKASTTNITPGSNVAHTVDLFNSKNQHLNYLVKPFDAQLADTLGKPSTEQVNKYLTVINTGVKNPDLIQIHPLLNNKTEIKTTSSSAPIEPNTTFPSLKEPVLIDSDDYPKYIEDISKHFGGLQVTDFPLYVQGLEFKQHSSNNKVSQSVVLTKPVRQPTEGIQASETISRQIVNNINNVQYVRINNNASNSTHNHQAPSVIAH